MLGIAIRWIINTIRDIFAKKSLEEKLGRKVASHEIYSLGANIEAAEAAPQSSPIAEQTAIPRQPMSKTTKIVLASVGAGFLFLAGAGVLFLVVMMMPEATYNRLNPFTPKVPEGAFPPTIAGRDRSLDPIYRNMSYCPCYEFAAYYKKDKSSINYKYVVFKTSGEAVEKMKSRYFVGGKPVVKEVSDSRMVIVDQGTGSTIIELISGNNLIHISAANAAEAIEFENALPYAALGMAQPPTRVAPAADVPTATPASTVPNAKKATP